MALVLALFPIAMERCRTACTTGASPTIPAVRAAHACHEAASDDHNSPRMDPMARACGHSDEARTFESASLAPGQTRTVPLTPAVEPRHQPIDAAVISFSSASSPDRSSLPPALASLNSPLRL